MCTQSAYNLRELVQRCSEYLQFLRYIKRIIARRRCVGMLPSNRGNPMMYYVTNKYVGWLVGIALLTPYDPN